MHPHSDLSVHALNVHINFMIVSCLRSFSTLIHNNSRKSTVTNLMPVTIQPHHIHIQLQLTSTYHTNSTETHIHIHCKPYSIQPLAGKVQYMIQRHVQDQPFTFLSEGKRKEKRKKEAEIHIRTGKENNSQ